MPGPQHPELSPGLLSPGLLPPVPGQGASQLTRVELGPRSPPWGGESSGDLSPAKVSEAPEKLELPFCSCFSVNTSSRRSTPVTAAPLSSAACFWSQVTFLGE